MELLDYLLEIKEITQNPINGIICFRRKYIYRAEVALYNSIAKSDIIRFIIDEDDINNIELKSKIPLSNFLIKDAIYKIFKIIDKYNLCNYDYINIKRE